MLFPNGVLPKMLKPSLSHTQLPLRLSDGYCLEPAILGRPALALSQSGLLDLAPGPIGQIGPWGLYHPSFPRRAGDVHWQTLERSQFSLSRSPYVPPFSGRSLFCSVALLLDEELVPHGCMGKDRLD